MDISDIKRKIAALLAKAESTDNVYESDAFMAKVNELLETHQIEMHELHVKNDPMGDSEGSIYLHDTIQWALSVMGVLAKYYGARFVFWRAGNRRPYRLYGVESARITTELMGEYVISQVKQQAKEYARVNRCSAQVAQRNVGLALASRISQMIPATEEKRAANAANALVPMTDVDAYMKGQLGELKKGRAKTYASNAREYADRISLNRQATGVGRRQITG